jgi:hypothetical protein
MQYRTGGWLFDDLAKDGKLLPYLKKQEGGNTGYRNMRDLVESNKNVEFKDEDREMMGKRDEMQDFDESAGGVGFDSKIKEVLENENYDSLPVEIRDELEFFKENPDEQSKLTEDYVVKYMPTVHSFLNSSSQGKTSEPKPTAVIEDFETRDNPKFQYGGHTNFQDYSNARQQSSPTTTPKYETGMRIQYRSGGQIKEGVIQHYDHVTGKIKLY